MYLSPLRALGAGARGRPPMWLLATAHALAAEALRSLGAARALGAPALGSLTAEALRSLAGARAGGEGPRGGQAPPPPRAPPPHPELPAPLSPGAAALAGLSACALAWAHPAFATPRALYSALIAAYVPQARVQALQEELGFALPQGVA